MKICPNCEKSIPDNSEMCPYCLYAFEVKKPPTVPKPKPIFDPASQPKPNGGDDVEEASHLKRSSYQKKWPVKRLAAIIILGSIALMIINSIRLGSSSEVEKDDVPQEVTVEPVEDTPEPAAVVSNESDEGGKEDSIAEEEEFVFADSNSRYLTEEDLDKLTSSELRIARNEIYARHHRLFDDEGLQVYFNECSWYEGMISPSDFTEAYAASVFNEYELYNKDFILAYENSQK